MKFLKLNKKTKITEYLTINDLKKINIDFENTIDRKRYKILILDDDGFNIDGLINLGYKDITVEFKYNNIDQFIPYQIILCDINGIAPDLDPKYQGAALSKKIKETYPDKIVIIFSALELPLDFEKYYRVVDAVIPKNTNNSDLSTLLDKYINKLSSPIDRWM